MSLPSSTSKPLVQGLNEAQNHLGGSHQVRLSASLEEEGKSRAGGTTGSSERPVWMLWPGEESSKRSWSYLVLKQTMAEVMGERPWGFRNQRSDGHADAPSIQGSLGQVNQRGG